VYTDANGNYVFRNLRPGTYVVTFDVDEESFRYTIPNAGDDAIDSDATEAFSDPIGTPFRRIYAVSDPVNLLTHHPFSCTATWSLRSLQQSARTSAKSMA